jgi:hypothetical protein
MHKKSIIMKALAFSGVVILILGSYLAVQADPLSALLSETVQSDPAVVVWLPLDEGSGTVAGDISGRGNHGSLVNGASFASGSGDGSPSRSSSTAWTTGSTWAGWT